MFGVLEVNGRDYSSLLNEIGEYWVTIPDETSLNSIKYGITIGNGQELCSLFAVEVDGSILIDGPANTSQVWSSNGTFTGSGNSPEQLFNNDFSNGMAGITDVGYDNAVRWVPSTPIPYTNSVKLIGQSGSLAGRMNDGQWFDGTSSTEVVLASGQSGTITSLELTEQRASAGYGWRGVEIDGALLVDKSPKEKKVTTLAAKRGQGTVSDITGSQVTITPFTDNAFVPGQWLTVDKPVTVKPVTDVITNYANLSKTISVDGVVGIAELEAGDAVYMADANGNEANPEFGPPAITAVNTTSVDWSANHFNISVGGGNQSWTDGPLAFNGNDGDGAYGSSPETNQLGTFQLRNLDNLGDFFCNSFTFKMRRRGYETPSNDYGRRVRFYYTDGTVSGVDSVEAPESGTNHRTAVNSKSRETSNFN